MTLWLTLAVILTIIGVLPFAIEALRPKMNDTRRADASGQFANLKQGITHYVLSGPVDGLLVVCIHGLTTPCFVWDKISKGLARPGYRVLIYDLYGRGFSDRPKSLQDQAFFDQQLLELLAYLELEEPFDLIGYSMGGAVATGFAAKHLHRVRSLALLASAGTGLVEAPMLKFIRDGRIFGAWLMLVAYPAQLRRGIQAERALPTVDTHVSDAQEAQLTYSGFIPAVRSSLRGVLYRPLADAHQVFHKVNIPMLAIWGGQDEVIPMQARQQLAAWNSDVRDHIIENAGHGLPYTHSDEVLALLTGFLARSAPQKRAE
ncbi:MAG: alpha/beta hydrolase [Sulfitobacter sp.]